jgi:hypothetical protein
MKSYPFLLFAVALPLLPFPAKADDSSGNAFDRSIRRNNATLFKEGRQIFRYDTFGDEAFWGDATWWNTSNPCDLSVLEAASDPAEFGVPPPAWGSLAIEFSFLTPPKMPDVSGVTPPGGP